MAGLDGRYVGPGNPKAFGNAGMGATCLADAAEIPWGKLAQGVQGMLVPVGFAGVVAG